MSDERRLLADAREFVTRALSESEGHRPTKKTVEAAARRISAALLPAVRAAAKEVSPAGYVPRNRRA